MSLEDSDVWQYVTSLSGGRHIAIYFPATLTPADFEDFQDWIDVVIRTVERRVVKRRPVEELPQFREGEQIDITGGVDSVEYIRRMRDAEG